MTLTGKIALILRYFAELLRNPRQVFKNLTTSGEVSGKNNCLARRMRILLEGLRTRLRSDGASD